eukprot:scaffold73684_cov74-Phaeocystis_antarctica.AAC.3
MCSAAATGRRAPGAHSPHASRVCARSIRWRNFTRLAAAEPPPYRPLMESRAGAYRERKSLRRNNNHTT